MVIDKMSNFYQPSVNGHELTLALKVNKLFSIIKYQEVGKMLLLTLWTKQITVDKMWAWT